MNYQLNQSSSALNVTTQKWAQRGNGYRYIQRVSDLPEGSGPASFSIKPGNSLNPKLLKANINLGLGKFYVKPGILF